MLTNGGQSIDGASTALSNGPTTDPTLPTNTVTNSIANLIASIGNGLIIPTVNDSSNCDSTSSTIPMINTISMCCGPTSTRAIVNSISSTTMGDSLITHSIPPTNSSGNPTDSSDCIASNPITVLYNTIVCLTIVLIDTICDMIVILFVLCNTTSDPNNSICNGTNSTGVLTAPTNSAVNLTNTVAIPIIASNGPTSPTINSTYIIPDLLSIIIIIIIIRLFVLRDATRNPSGSTIVLISTLTAPTDSAVNSISTITLSGNGSTNATGPTINPTITLVSRIISTANLTINLIVNTITLRISISNSNSTNLFSAPVSTMTCVDDSTPNPTAVTLNPSGGSTVPTNLTVDPTDTINNLFTAPTETIYDLPYKVTAPTNFAVVSANSMTVPTNTAVHLTNSVILQHCCDTIVTIHHANESIPTATAIATTAPSNRINTNNFCVDLNHVLEVLVYQL